MAGRGSKNEKVKMKNEKGPGLQPPPRYRRKRR